MTFSIVARCPHSGMFGMTVASSSPAVAARCAHARAGVGAVASQNITDPSLGPALLDQMQNGLDATEAMAAVAADSSNARHLEYRQLTAVDKQGRTAVYQGAHTLGVHATVQGDNAAAAGNLLGARDVPQAMLQAFTESGAHEHLGDRLLKAMRAALAAGGEEGPVHSAGMLLVDELPWPVAELRCDWSGARCPIEDIAAAWEVYKPQLTDYITRALNPAAAPNYGVPGDE